MAVSVQRVARLIDSSILVHLEKGGEEFASAATSVEQMVEEGGGPAWNLELMIGDGKSAKQVIIELPEFVSTKQVSLSNIEPLLLAMLGRDDAPDRQYALFRHTFFSIEPRLRNDAMREEAVLRIKRLAYAEDAELASLRSYVANMEAAVEFERGSPRRTAIPDDVKLAVWARDGGACVRCGSASQLHFDHIIPVAKGGNNLVENIQLLCQPCNLRKSDKIVF